MEQLSVSDFDKYFTIQSGGTEPKIPVVTAVSRGYVSTRPESLPGIRSVAGRKHAPGNESLLRGNVPQEPAPARSGGFELDHA